MYTDHHTIAAPATAAGGALAVIRISGADSLTICNRIFRGRTTLTDAAPNSVHYGYIVDQARTIDEVLATVFRAPRSYTGEDAVEISCHGSGYIVAEILRLLVNAGARMARPGEFTTRAFLAGKIDLAQAEAVADLIASSSRAAHAVATTQMRGGYSAALTSLRSRLLHLASLLELELDFSEEDVEFADRTELRQTMEEIVDRIDSLRHSFSLGNVLKHGVAVAIVGRPNVGKSTLLNRLLGEEKALVSEIAGTTRDIIEDTTDIEGVCFRFIDTAGIRHTGDQLEQMGIDRAVAAAQQAQIIILLRDAAAPQDTDVPLPPLRADQHLIEVVNKLDVTPNLSLSDNMIGISAKENQGLDMLRQALRQTIDTTDVFHGDAIVSSARHYASLSSAHTALTQAISALAAGCTADLLSEEIRASLHHLGEITGEITSDEILGNIFSKFCIGK